MGNKHQYSEVHSGKSSVLFCSVWEVFTKSLQKLPLKRSTLRQGRSSAASSVGQCFRSVMGAKASKRLHHASRDDDVGGDKPGAKGKKEQVWTGHWHTRITTLFTLWAVSCLCMVATSLTVSYCDDCLHGARSNQQYSLHLVAHSDGRGTRIMKIQAEQLAKWLAELIDENGQTKVRACCGGERACTLCRRTDTRLWYFGGGSCTCTAALELIVDVCRAHWNLT